MKNHPLCALPSQGFPSARRFVYSLRGDGKSILSLFIFRTFVKGTKSMKNRLLSAILALCLLCSLLSGCGRSYTVRLNENYPGGNTTEISAASAKTIKETAPVREGYVFEGWYKDENLTEPWTDADKVKGDLTLYAAWDKDTGDAIQEPGNDKDFSRLRTPGSQEDEIGRAHV